MAKVYKLIEVGEYEALKKLEDTSDKATSSKNTVIKASEIKKNNNSHFGDSEESSNTSFSEGSETTKNPSFTECDWRAFEDCFTLSDGGKIYRKKICKRKK